VKSQSRRNFLTTTSVAVAAAFDSRGWNVGPVLSGASLMRASARTPSTLLPEPADPINLRAIAAAAVEAGDHAGAEATDVRVAERHLMSIRLGLGDTDPDIRLEATFEYGVRVYIDGVYAFEHGTAPSKTAIESATRRAIDSARGYRALASAKDPGLMRVPVRPMTAAWVTPITIDPFAVPVEDQYGLLVANRDSVHRVLGAWASSGSRGQSPGFEWTRETRVFASSDGVMLTQTFYRSDPNLSVVADRGLESVSVWCDDVVARSGGYETVLIDGLQERLKATAEDAVRLATLPQRVIDIGRYPVVFDGYSVSATLSHTIGRALEMDRVLGDDIDTSGSSYLAPPEDILGVQTFSPLLTVNAGRSLPSLAAAQWDDEGVVTETYPVIDAGRVVDYHTGRDSAPTLRSWYERHGQAIRSRGCAVAPRASDPVLVRTPHLTVLPGRVQLADLIRDVSRGLLVRQAPYVSVAPHLRTGDIMRGSFLEIEHGKVVRRIKNAGLQFNTTAFWKGLSMLGDSTTVRTAHVSHFKGQPWSTQLSGATAPAALFKEINVLRPPTR
jgi:TldD protein